MQLGIISITTAAIIKIGSVLPCVSNAVYLQSKAGQQPLLLS